MDVEKEALILQLLELANALLLIREGGREIVPSKTAGFKVSCE